MLLSDNYIKNITLKKVLVKKKIEIPISILISSMAISGWICYDKTDMRPLPQISEKIVNYNRINRSQESKHYGKNCKLYD